MRSSLSYPKAINPEALKAGIAQEQENGAQGQAEA